MAAPTKINLLQQIALEIVWNDGRIHQIPLRYLRDESPDAGNKGETILWKHYAPQKSPDLPGKYEVKDIKVVGNYAIQIYWKDGNNDGLYSWELLDKWGELFASKANLN